MNSQKTLNILVLGLIGAILILAYILYQEMLLARAQLKIAGENHIISLYSSYKNNMDSCKSLALQDNKDITFIMENCIKPINSSLVGKGLYDWGRSDLLISE